MTNDLVCWNCGASLAEVPRPISRHSNCPKCFEVLHCCRMCRRYAPGRPGDCDHDRTEPPVDKESANFCEYFLPAAGTYAAVEGARKDAAKSKLDALFGEGGGDASPDADQDDTKSRLDDLFDD